MTGAGVFGGGFQYSRRGGRTFSDPEARLTGQGREREAGTNAGASTRRELARLSRYQLILSEIYENCKDVRLFRWFGD